MKRPSHETSPSELKILRGGFENGAGPIDTVRFGNLKAASLRGKIVAPPKFILPVRDDGFVFALTVTVQNSSTQIFQLALGATILVVDAVAPRARASAQHGDSAMKLAIKVNAMFVASQQRPAHADLSDDPQMWISMEVFCGACGRRALPPAGSHSGWRFARSKPWTGTMSEQPWMSEKTMERAKRSENINEHAELSRFPP